MTRNPEAQTNKPEARDRSICAPGGTPGLKRAPRRRRAKSRTKSPQPEVSHTELCRQMADEARRLRSLAVAVRKRMKAPVIEEYVRNGRGPAYQRDYEAHMKKVHVAYAFDDAAYQLEQALASRALAC